ncbi:MAG: AAA family ATPase [Bacilli bacterium]
MSKCVAVLGCSSSVGKSTIVTALCRYYSNKDIVPFKAFNLSSEGFKYNDLFIGYAQYVQAIAAKKEYQGFMNPILKRYTNNNFEIYLNGLKKEGFSIEEGKKVVDEAFLKLISNHQYLIVEGSGSVAELNIMDLDIANTTFAIKHNIPIILVADISRGGVFGTLYGNYMLLSKEARSLVKGFIINKFDGDPKCFDSGVKIIEELCSKPVIGVVPRIEFQLPHEDTHCNEVECSEIDIESNIEHLCKEVIKHLDMNYIDNKIFN